ncbi:Dihydroxyacetone kinase, ATP-dependent [Minicystis rosea]|nr:Dihydroxyacetone kinase, ATP-dependent [Minicystis rosea]
MCQDGGVKHFINDRSDIVTEAIDAVVALSGGKLGRLDGYPGIKVVVRTDWDKSKVAVVSGGGAGHEPAHVGFVGEGMLTAAVSGEIFASPSVDAVLAGILAVTGDAGCLLIVKNYTGDRLNFGLAAEKARALGLDVEMVIVSDDIAIADAPRPRGLAGTLFVHKVAGHLAQAGATLAAVKEGAERVARSVRSLGISLSTGTIPGQPTEVRLGPDEVELGLGIHGEPGAEKIAYRPMDELAATMAARLDRALAGTRQPVAVLINDLGGVPPIEMGVATRALLGAMKHEVALVVGPERLMTSLDMKGLSISVLPLDTDTAIAISSEVAPRAWPRAQRPREVTPLPLPERLKRAAHTPSSDAPRRRVVEIVCNTLAGLEAELNALDAKVGDGDTGSTFATAARSILADLDTLPFAEPAALCSAIADRLAKGMGGSSGILLSIGVSAMGASMAGAGASPDAAAWTAALHEGIRRIQQYGGAHEGDRTMLDALVPAVRALEAGEGLDGAAAAARRGASLTATMKSARAGRSSYVPEAALQGVPDPGAMAFAAIFEALARR